MIKDRNKEITVGIALALVISLAFFYFDDEKLSVPSGITGFSAYEDYQESKEAVIVSGIEFKAVIGDKEYYYIFSDERKWYESKKDFEWTLRKDMGNTLWQGIYYLKSYDARIYFNDKELADIAEFARGKK